MSMIAKTNVKTTLNGKRAVFKPGDKIPANIPQAELAYLKKVGAVVDDVKAEAEAEQEQGKETTPATDAKTAASKSAAKK